MTTSNGLSVNDITPLGERPADVWRGRTGILGAGVFTITGSPISRTPNDGEILVYDAASDTYLQVNEFDLLNSGYVLDGALAPTATISATKSASNPTFNFAAVPENILKVGATYWAVYMDNVGATATFNLASATDKNGPWTAYGSNPIYQIASVTWAAASTGMYAPHLVEDQGTFYLFYSVVVTGGATAAGNAIGYATASAVTGTYTDHGSSILAPGAGAAWDSRRVGEPAVRKESNRWVMAYMGETSAAAYQASEKIGIATATTPGGTWTKAAANPVLDYTGSETLLADPDLWYANGYYWIMYAYETGGVTPAQQGFAYSLTATGAYTRHASNPIVPNGAAAAFDETLVFRGCVWLEDGAYTGIYAAQNSGGTFRGGNFTLTITPANGTVTSVGLSVPAEFSVSGSPVTGSGTITVSKATETANTVWAGPTSGSAAQPAFRSLVAADIPNIATTQPMHVHVATEQHLSDGSTTTYTLDHYYMPESVVAWNTTTLARLTVTEVQPDKATVSAAGTTGDKIVFDYAASLT